MTGWRMIWRKCSQRRRGGFGWNRVGCGERTPPRRQQQEVKTRPAEVMIVLFFFHSISLHISLRILSLLCSSSLPGSAVSSSSSRNLSLKKNGSLKPHQVKMTQMPGMVRLGKREINRSHNPTVTDDDDLRAETPPPPQIHVQVRSHPLF